MNAHDTDRPMSLEDDIQTVNEVLVNFFNDNNVPISLATDSMAHLLFSMLRQDQVASFKLTSDGYELTFKSPSAVEDKQEEALVDAKETH